MAKINLYGKKLNNIERFDINQPNQSVDEVEPLVKAPSINTDAKVEPTNPPKQEIITPTTKPAPTFDPQGYLGDTFANRPKLKPYNTSYENQQKALMKAQTFGNLLALIGDVGGVAVGANVARRGQKPLEPYMQAIINKREQYEKDKKVFNRQEFEDKLKEGARLEGQGRYEAGVKTKAEETTYERGRDALKDERYDKENDWAKYKWLKEQERYKEADALRAKIERNRATKDRASLKEKPYMEVRIGGVDEGLSEGEYREYLREALLDEGYTDEEIIGLEDDENNLNSIDAERKVANYLMKKTKKNPYFREFFKQRNSGKFGTYRDYYEQFENPLDPGAKKTTTKTPSFFK